MFAKGNVTERGKVPQKIRQNEVIFDMFAGIGYFTLGMAKVRKAAHLYSFEWNPTAFASLQQNLKLNHLEAYVTPIFGDCTVEVPKLVATGARALPKLTKLRIPASDARQTDIGC